MFWRQNPSFAAPQRSSTASRRQFRSSLTTAPPSYALWTSAEVREASPSTSCGVQRRKAAEKCAASGLRYVLRWIM
eukprot:6984342-Prorocentrum_lima.AAC.1